MSDRSEQHEDLVVSGAVTIPARELQFSYMRSSGPGGQNVNKVNTKVRMHWDVLQSDALPPALKDRFLRRFANRLNVSGQFVLASQRHRDQHRNVIDCRNRLRDMLQQVLEPERKRKPTRPTRGSVRRRLQNKKHRSEVKRRRQPPSMDD